MCWFFMLIVNKKYEETVETISQLLDLHAKYGLKVPEQIYKDYKEDENDNTDILGKDKDLCLCPLSLSTLGHDELSRNIQICVGEFKFKKINDKEIFYEYGIAPKLEATIKISELNEFSLFHKIILTEIVEKNNSLIIECW